MLVRHDSLDLDDELHSRYEQLRDTFLRDEVLAHDALDGGIHNDYDGECAKREYDGNSYDSLNKCDDDSSGGNNPNTKLSDKLRMLATRTSQISQDELYSAVQSHNYRHKYFDYRQL